MLLLGLADLGGLLPLVLRPLLVLRLGLEGLADLEGLLPLVLRPLLLLPPDQSLRSGRWLQSDQSLLPHRRDQSLQSGQ